MTSSEGQTFKGILKHNLADLLSCSGQRQLEIAQSEQDVSPFRKESDMTYS